MPHEIVRAPASVLLVEGDFVTREALRLAIESDPGMNLAAVLDNISGTLEWLESHSVDVLVTELDLPDGSGIEIIHACVKRHPVCDTMVIAMPSGEGSVVACIEAGASGYMLKHDRCFDLAEAVCDLCAGGSQISPTIARLVIAQLRDRKTATLQSTNVQKSDTAALTKLEATILGLIACGDTYGEVAKTLSLSIGTVQAHIKSIYGKLSVHSRDEAVFEVYRRDLLQLGPRERV